ncbi:hypothetical protein ACHAQA_003385 [Verticillium albo-atrum]
MPGIVFNSASAALFLCIQGQGTKVFRDGLRLVLITFLASSALWAQIDFIATLIDPASPLGCQVAVVFASSFDQIARLALEQYLLWAINSGVKPSPDTFIPQALLFIRLLVGGIFVAFQRPQLLPVCQPSNNMVAIGIAVAATDAVIIAIFILRAFMTGLVQDFQEKRPGFQRAKAVLLLIAGLALWTGASVPLFLGLQSIDIIWRTALPAGALSVLLGLVAVFLGPLVLTRARASAVPQDATSPPDDFQNRSSHVRDISSSESNYPPNRYEDLKTGTTTSITATRALNAGNGGAAFGAAAGGMAWQARRSSDERDQSTEYQRSRANISTRGGPLANGITVGKLAISHPILQKVDEDSPFNKIATIDLATAARNEKERRNLAALQDSSTLVAPRAAPQPPAITAEEAMKRSQSKMKRKEIIPSSQDTMEPQGFEDTTRLLPTANATSSQASPGMESLRRRSPRQSPKELSLDQQDGRTTSRGSPLAAQWQPTTPEEKQFPTRRSMESSSSQQTAVPSISPSQTIYASPQSAKQVGSPPRPELPPTWPKQTSVRNTIRPSRMQASTVQAVPALPLPQAQQGADTATAASQPPPPLQRRGTVGLPSNPRAHGMKTAGQDGGSQPTVLFMNQIQYNNPAAVQSIIDGATGQVVVKANAEVGKSRDSVVHRPRPIPRQQDSDRQLFPSEQSPRGHVRNRSGGSIASRKSILRSTPGSPTQLPALPPLPKSAGQPTRPQPNDTRSMTFNEKMELFFPGAPKSAGPTASVFRGSIPELPPLPAAYSTEKNKSIKQASDAETAQKALSKRSIASSQQTSLRTQSIFEIEEQPARMPDIRNTSKFSVDTYTTADRMGAEEVHDSWIPIMPERPRSERSYEGSRRRSSPVIPVMDSRMSEYSDARTRDEEATTNWGSIHSPVAAVNIKKARQVPVSTYIQNPDSGHDPRNVSMVDSNDGKEVLTIMLDASIEHDRSMATASWFDERQHPDNMAALNSQWHHRLGDECTTFSARKERVVSRRMPPPTPLLLNSTSKNSIIVAAEPSPLESPQEAYEVIQQQLKRLEELDRDPMQDESERLRLLESLEQEMGQQEYQWHEMKNGLSRDSVSTVETHSSRHSEAEMATAGTQSRQSQSSSIAADRRASRRARLQSSVRPSRDSATDTISTGTESRRESRWQQKLADAETEYAENAADFMAKPFLNFLSVSVPKGQLGSPTPPDTDESDSEELSSRAKAVLARKNAPHAKLWKPSSPEPPAWNRSLLWAAPARIRPPVAPEDLPGLSVRPFARKASDVLEIESTRLWNRRNTFAAKPHSVTVGLWRGSPIPAPVQQQVNVRPVTQRPPRRNKRVTLLPDIIESPKELPDKRGTLGIFQFPWGEKSDTATVQVRPSMFMAMPGTMSSGGPGIRAALEARAKQLEAQEYSASFFDDYDDEEDATSSDDDYDYQEDDEEEEEEQEAEDVVEVDEDASDYSEEGSEDEEDFDESTLWEIASLLKSDQVPSKNSLLPQPHRQSEPSIEDFFIFDASEFKDEDMEDQTQEQEDDLGNKHDSGSTAFDVDEFPAPPRAATLWTDVSEESAASRGVGLPDVDEQTWSRYVPTTDDLPRSRPKAAEPAVIQSTMLWSSPSSPVEAPVSMLWVAPKVNSEPSLKSTTPSPMPLWTAVAAAVTEEPYGLYSPSHDRSEYRTTTAEPAAKHISRKPRLVEEPLAQLPSSSSLWAEQPRLSDKPMWMLSASTSQVIEEATTEAPTVVLSHAVASKPVADQLLWAAPIKSVDEESRGLFTTSSNRLNYRTTTASPAALMMVRKPRQTAETAPEIPLSALLWDQVQPYVKSTARADTFWIASATATHENPTISSASSLWTAPAAAVHHEPSGLYQAGRPRTSFRTTSAEPAALETPRRPRVNQEPVSQLSSSALWRRASIASYEYDWISIASVGPQSPSYASSSGRSTPTSESASLKTTSTKASSLATSIANAILKDGFPGPKEPTWWEEPKQPTLPQLPGDEEVTFTTTNVQTPKLPDTLSTPTLKPRLRRVGEASPADWDTELLYAVVAGLPREQEQPEAATPAQWDDALNQAVKAGRPQRPQFTTSEWDLALEEALSAGRLTPVSSQSPEEVKSVVKPFPHHPATSLWFQSPKEADNHGSLWTRAASAHTTSGMATFIESRADDLETQRLRRKRVQALIPKSRKAEIRRQIAAIEAGADPATVGLVNFSGHSLWAHEDAGRADSSSIRGHGRDWLRL